MRVQDVVYGRIEFGDDEVGHLAADLVRCPEVYRLRHMRLLNFDVPYVQELATARRFAHSIGTAHVANVLGSKSRLSVTERKQLVAAALVHDIGIPPFGHLVESELSSVDPTFSHERLVREILYGLYHPTNIYHQILDGRTLQVAAVLRDHDVDPEDIINLVCPGNSSSSAVSGTLDVDNIDNVHRMVALLGIEHARWNVQQLLRHARISKSMELVFQSAALASIRIWMEMRAYMYRIMIAHPECVAYNALLQDLVRLALQEQVITSDTWYQTDSAFERNLLDCSATKSLAAQLQHGSSYRLIDYLWLHGDSSSPLPVDPLQKALLEHGRIPPLKGTKYFFWAERRKISRRICIHLEEASGPVEVGSDSSSLLVAIIDPGTASATESDRFARVGRAKWRREMLSLIGSLAGDSSFSVTFPETFSEQLGHQKENAEQTELF